MEMISALVNEGKDLSATDDWRSAAESVAYCPRWRGDSNHRYISACLPMP